MDTDLTRTQAALTLCGTEWQGESARAAVRAAGNMLRARHATYMLASVADDRQREIRRSESLDAMRDAVSMATLADTIAGPMRIHLMALTAAITAFKQESKADTLFALPPPDEPVWMVFRCPSPLMDEMNLRGHRTAVEFVGDHVSKSLGGLPVRVHVSVCRGSSATVDVKVDVRNAAIPSDWLATAVTNAVKDAHERLQDHTP